MSNLVTLPIEDGEDNVLCKLVATYLAKYGFQDQDSLIHAYKLVAALERYRAGKNMNHFARNLGMDAETVALYRKQEK